MIILRHQVCQEAMSWVGTPYKHQAMVKGEDGGVDCAMLIAGVALNTRLITDDDIKKIPPYPAEWHYHSDFPLLIKVMESFGCTPRIGEYQPADILTFKIGKTVSHLGIYLGAGWFVHAEGRGPMKVTKTTLNGSWLRRLEGAYVYPRLEDAAWLS